MLFSKIIKKKFDAVLGRYDGDPAYYYFSPKDFPAIHADPYDVIGDRQVTLKGFFYYYGELCPEKLVIFDHGIGAGHRGYFKEIEYLARNGCTVYSYDHTGCVESGGTGILGFAQGVNDLDHVLAALKQDPRFANQTVKLVGHSWGAYAAMNAAQFHPQVTHVVSLGGFLSAEALITQYIPRMFHRYCPEVMDRERQHNPRYADLDARESMKKTRAKLLHFQSKDDRMVRYELSMVPLSQALAQRENTRFVTMEHHGHEPHLTEAAVQANQELMQTLRAMRKKKELRTPGEIDTFRRSQDWALLTQQDPATWDQILDFLQN